MQVFSAVQKSCHNRIRVARNGRQWQDLHRTRPEGSMERDIPPPQQRLRLKCGTVILVVF